MTVAGTLPELSGAPLRVGLVGGSDPRTELVACALRRRAGTSACLRLVRQPEIELQLAAGRLDAAVYLADSRSGAGPRPDLEDAARAFDRFRGAGVRRVVVVSSAAVAEPHHHHPGWTAEARPGSRRRPGPIARGWLALEELAASRLESARLAILRPVPVPVTGGDDLLSRRLGARFAPTVPGFDPNIQLLAPDDLAEAIGLALDRGAGGIYQVAPGEAVPLSQAIRLAGSRRLPLPRWLQRAARRVTSRLTGRLTGAHPDEVDYLRYPSTVSGRAARDELGFAPRRSSAEVARGLRRRGGVRRDDPVPAYDRFGLDKGYVARYGRTLFRFLHDLYWRIELDGLERVPRRGRGVLVGIHRGFMPWDGVMLVHAIARHLGRHPRFLIHPTLVKFPFLANYMTKLGGIHASRENADWVLEEDELLGIFPEGIRGAFTLYREAYQLKKFGRDEYVRMALRNWAPIVPFVTVGSAEIFPILGKLRWRWWSRYTEWPCFPITPTMGLVPLPSKWHTRFLEPIHVEARYSPEDADDPEVVRAIGREVKARMREALDDMLARRKSVFYGSVFGGEPA